jgi:rod shape-determining protein MreD
VYATIALAYVLNVSRLSSFPWAPDFLAVTLVFWTVREPRITGVLLPFLLGILMDVFDGAILGQHALSYMCLCFCAHLLERRIPWFTPVGQALHLLPIFLITQAIVLFIRYWMGGVFPGWIWFLQSFANALIWPIASHFLLMPQRRTQNKDDTPI